MAVPARRLMLGPTRSRQVSQDAFAAAYAAARSGPARRRAGSGGARGGGMEALEAWERRAGAEYTLVVELRGVCDIRRLPPSRLGGPAGRVYGCHQLLDFPPACTAPAVLLGGGELSAWTGGRAEYRVRCTPDGDARLLHGRLEVAVVDDSDPPGGGGDDDDDDAAAAAEGGGSDGLCVGTCSVALAALVSRRGLAGRAPLTDADGLHCGYVELGVFWAPAPADAAPSPRRHDSHGPSPPPPAPVNVTTCGAEREPGQGAGGGAGGSILDDTDDA